jgi:methylphosphotriester-DNA--protein-cysteine methyltransferase
LDTEEGCSRCQAQKEINNSHILGKVNNVCMYININISFTLNLAVTKKQWVVEKNYLHI